MDYKLDLGNVGRNITTGVPEAQVWFDRGLANLLGFNHEESARLFRLALDADPNCAMAHWGVASSLVGNYNNPEGLDYAGAGVAIKLASKSLVLGATEIEKDLVAAFTVLCKDVSPDLTGFANEMRKVYKKHPKDPEVACVFAESLMNLAPWKLWTPRSEGRIVGAIPETVELVQLLEDALLQCPTHPGLCHLYIHTMELSPTPEKALEAANVLRTRVPGQGHLLHMASHIDMWVGQYNQAVQANIAAVVADEEYVRITGNEENFYKFYRMHDYHFVCWAAMFDGQYDVALDYAERALAQLTPKHVQFLLGGVIPMGAVFLEPFATIKWHVFIRFGKWDEILSEPIPDSVELFPTVVATAHYARGIAFAALGQIDNAEMEQEKFTLAMADPALDGRYLHNNLVVDRKTSSSILHVAEAMLDGELAYRKGDFALAFEKLQLAVERDTTLVYDEPWGWMVPARHALGALLSEQKRYEEAIDVFEEDLEQYKDNMWALRGLLTCYRALNKPTEDLQNKLKTAQARSTEKFDHACYCAGLSVGE